MFVLESTMSQLSHVKIERGSRRKLNLLEDSNFGIINKKEIYNIMVISKMGSLHEKAGSIEYRMPKAMADAYLKSRKGEDAKMRPNDYLVKVVNEEFGFLHHCDSVAIV